ncbi:uncharacterized protein LOC101847490 [Aplysia californica]|uniref:Uncharacterized protein LOC101847490 n=1 Tax=Aplysia californica TaxID=6500 RepID=A0ABM0ZZ00_APLCA|nr:uncharacterized protein LOC101847490 [Aplysia californica]
MERTRNSVHLANGGSGALFVNGSLLLNGSGSVGTAEKNQQINTNLTAPDLKIFETEGEEGVVLKRNGRRRTLSNISEVSHGGDLIGSRTSINLSDLHIQDEDLEIFEPPRSDANKSERSAINIDGLSVLNTGNPHPSNDLDNYMNNSVKSLCFTDRHTRTRRLSLENSKETFDNGFMTRRTSFDMSPRVTAQLEVSQIQTSSQKPGLDKSVPDSGNGSSRTTGLSGRLRHSSASSVKSKLETKRSNLKRESSLPTLHLARFGLGTGTGEGKSGKKSISFSNIVHVDGVGQEPHPNCDPDNAAAFRGGHRGPDQAEPGDIVSGSSKVDAVTSRRQVYVCDQCGDAPCLCGQGGWLRQGDREGQLSTSSGQADRRGSLADDRRDINSKIMSDETAPTEGGKTGRPEAEECRRRKSGDNFTSLKHARTSSETSASSAGVSKDDVTRSKSGVDREESTMSDDVFRLKEISCMLPKELKNSLVVILSGLYGLLLIVLGLVLPITETFADANQPFMFEVYYLYLYAVSLVFLLYVYSYLLRKEELSILGLHRALSRTFSRTFSKSSAKVAPPTAGPWNNPGERSWPNIAASRASQSPHSRAGQVPLLVRQNSTISCTSVRHRRRKIAFNPNNAHHTGSFYLRVGVIGFGIGSMIHSGLTFGHYFEINHLGDPCSDVIQAIKPFFHCCFSFVQMYFVFMNSKMCIHKYRTLARFGLMHMSGTNICVWLRSIVVETLHVIEIEKRKTLAAYYASHPNITEGNATALDLEELSKDHHLGSLPELNCHWDAMMGKVVEKASVYLYPCTIEYSLVCACVLYVMWSNVGEGHVGDNSSGDPRLAKRKQPIIESASEYDDDDDDDDDANMEAREKTQKMSVDCAGSSQGLFMGIFVFVGSVVCLVCFYVLIGTEKHMTTGSLLGHISEDVVYLVTLIATAVAAYQMRQMHFSLTREAGIEEILTLISLSGLGLYGMFSIVASIFYLDTLDGGLTIITNLFMLVQAGAQATFTLAALRVSAVDSTQVREKPGKQYVTFLLVSNFALWAINTFETQSLEHNIIQVDFYGATAWSIFSHISVPLGIYFRFHSMVSLSTVWKNAWKMKHVQNKAHLTRHTTL